MIYVIRLHDGVDFEGQMNVDCVLRGPTDPTYFEKRYRANLARKSKAIKRIHPRAKAVPFSLSEFVDWLIKKHGFRRVKHEVLDYH
jgi:hypothetical protein